MAKSKNNRIVTIDEVQYELHGTKVKVAGTLVPVGFAPVRLFSTVAEFRNYINDRSDGELELDIQDWQYGNGVRLQRLNRACTEVQSDRKNPTDAEKSQIYAEFTDDDRSLYAGKWDALNAEIKRRWELKRADQSDVDLLTVRTMIS